MRKELMYWNSLLFREPNAARSTDGNNGRSLAAKLL